MTVIDEDMRAAGVREYTEDEKRELAKLVEAADTIKYIAKRALESGVRYPEMFTELILPRLHGKGITITVAINRLTPDS